MRKAAPSQSRGMRPGKARKVPPASDLRQHCYKTTLCRYNHLGTCTRGLSCPFSHGEGELCDKVDLTKTKLCRLFLGGRCLKEGSLCRYAHGEGELRKGLPDGDVSSNYHGGYDAGEMRSNTADDVGFDAGKNQRTWLIFEIGKHLDTSPEAELSGEISASRNLSHLVSDIPPAVGAKEIDGREFCAGLDDGSASGDRQWWWTQRPKEILKEEEDDPELREIHTYNGADDMGNILSASSVQQCMSLGIQKEDVDEQELWEIRTYDGEDDIGNVLSASSLQWCSEMSGNSAHASPTLTSSCSSESIAASVWKVCPRCGAPSQQVYALFCTQCGHALRYANAAVTAHMSPIP